MSDHFKLFNEKAREFLERMSEAFPEEEKLKLYIFMFNQFEKADYTSPVNMFMDNLRPFGLQIMSKDEQFFKDDQYVNQVENLSGKIGLIKYWENMSETTKNSIWKYIQVLYISGMASLNLKDELNSIIKQSNSLKKKQ